MCYHYSIAKTAEEISRRYNIDLTPSGIIPEPLFYHVNGFDFPVLPVVCKDYMSGDLKLEFMQWGLVPWWVKGEEEALKIRGRTLNARSESADSKPSFRAAFRHRPCLVPATGYFEWMHQAGKKYPFFIYLTDEQCFSFAGIWEEWINSETGEILRSFSVITCQANSLTEKIHNSKKRMPVILARELESKWLSAGTGNKERLQMLKPFEAAKMYTYSISRLITSAGKNSNVPEVLEPFVYHGLN